MNIERALGICPLLLAFLIHSHPANAEDFGSLQRNADQIEQKLYSAATEHGDPSAMYALGVECEEQADEAGAFRWYRLAAAAGHSESMSHIGDMYSQGRGVPQDYVAAASWYGHAIQRGSVPALSNLASLYFYGFGVPQSYPTAVSLLKAGVRRGDPEAQEKLGALYETGVGLPRNLTRARSLYEQSAAQGYAPAMVNLGLLYIEAIGVRRNDVQGYALVAAASAIGIPDELQKLASAEINEATERLDARRIAEAQHLARHLIDTVSNDATP